MEALYGYKHDAIERARGLVQTATAYEPQLRAAVALALAGEPGEAESIVRRLRTVREEDTLLHRAYLPPAEAAVLLAKGSFDAGGRGAPAVRSGTRPVSSPHWFRIFFVAKRG